MNRKGFTLIDLLACLALLGIILLIGISVSRNTMSTSLVRLRTVSDNEVFSAANNYVLENNIYFNEHGYICINVSDLIDYGYLNDTNDNKIKNKIVAIYGNNNTKVITTTKYVDSCN